MNGDRDRSPDRTVARAACDQNIRIVGGTARTGIKLWTAAAAPIPITRPWHDLHVVLELTGRCRLDDEPIIPGRNPIAPGIPLIPHHLQVVSLRDIRELFLVDDRPFKRLHPPTGDKRRRRNGILRKVLGWDNELERYVYSSPVGRITGWSFALQQWGTTTLCRRHYADQSHDYHSQ
jgi:hypothetical protein